MAQRVGELGPGAGQQGREVVDLEPQRGDLLGLAGHRLDERGGVAVRREEHDVAAHPAQRDQRHRREHDGEHADGEGSDDEGVADVRVEGHVAQGIRA